jgi:hypothetical protein
MHPSSDNPSTASREPSYEADDFEPEEETRTQQDPDDPVTGDGSEGFPIRGGGSGS